MRFILGLLVMFAGSSLFSADWETVTENLAKKEKAGYGGICGVLVDHTNGHVFLNISDKGHFRSTDRGASFTPFSTPFKGRTEWPGCFNFDPTEKTNRLVTALVYGSPILVGDRKGSDWSVLGNKSVHIDWCVLDWAAADPKCIFAFKHESGGVLLRSMDGGKTYSEIGKGFSSAWVFDEKVAVVTQAKTKTQPNPKLMRTTDSGDTWSPVADFTTDALPKWRNGKLYWVVENALITTTDNGATWTKVSDLKDVKLGPIFGKKQGHLFVLTKAGISESFDDGKTWGKSIPLPKELKGWSALTWLDYDPINDILYILKMGSELFRLHRTQGEG